MSKLVNDVLALEKKSISAATTLKKTEILSLWNNAVTMWLSWCNQLFLYPSPSFRASGTALTHAEIHIQYQKEIVAFKPRQRGFYRLSSLDNVLEGEMNNTCSLDSWEIHNELAQCIMELVCLNNLPFLLQGNLILEEVVSNLTFTGILVLLST